MGIPKLWKKLEPICEKDVKLRSFEGKRVALDFSIIIHTAAYGFTSSKQNYNALTNHGRMIDAEKTEEELKKEEQDRIDEYISQCVDHALQKVYHMIQQGIELLVVLDGTTPPIKRMTTEGRRERQNVAKNYLRAGDDDGAEGAKNAEGAEGAKDGSSPDEATKAIPLPSFEEFASSQSILQELNDMANDGKTTFDGEGEGERGAKDRRSEATTLYNIAQGLTNNLPFVASLLARRPRHDLLGAQGRGSPRL